jgi:hypothetical protein
MKPEPEIETKGLTAYEQVRAFERLRTWRLPVVYTAAPIVPAVFGLAALRLGHPAYFAVGAGVAAFVAVRVWLQWRHLHRLYAENLTLLARLEATYGDALPWVQVENHFAALEEIQREIAEQKSRGQAGS